MSTTYHLCQDLQGALDNWSDRQWHGVVTENGKTLTPKQIKARFKALLAEGKRVIPFAECDNFDFQTGCKGHPEAAPT